MTKRFLIIFLLLLPFSLHAKEKVSLHADHLTYEEETQRMHASSNVKLNYKGVEIQTDSLCLDTLNDCVWGTGDIKIVRGADEFHSSYFFFDLKTEVVQLKDVNVAVQPPANSKKLYLKADAIEDNGDCKRGFGGFFTSCDHDPPHYGVWAGYFEYYPDQRIIGHNVLLYNPILAVPFGLWAPIYFYELGDRDIVWNFPSIGKKEVPGWGWFVQNTIDYDNIDGDDSSIFIDFFEFSGHNTWKMGGGIQHQYKVLDNKGTVYYYEFMPLISSKGSYKKSIEQNWEFSPWLNTRVKYEFIDAEPINSSGRQNSEKEEIDIKYNKLGDVYNVKLDSNQDYKSSYKRVNFRLDRSFNNEKQYDFSFNENTRSTSKQVSSKVNHFLYFPGGWKVSNAFDFQREEKEGQENPDDKLKTTIILTKTLTEDFQLGEDESLSMKLMHDHMIDLDDQRVTDDIQDNDYFFKHPEFTFDYNNRNLYDWDFSEQFVMARYLEKKYDRAAGKDTPQNVNYDLEPNTYIFKQNLSRTFTSEDKTQSIRVYTSYDQYVFKTPGRNLFEGDAMYRYKVGAEHSWHLFDFMKTKTSGSREYGNDQGNSPFFRFDGLNNADANSISETLVFYIDNENKYKWSHTSGYNWVNKKWNDYITDMRINPNETWSLNMRTGKILEPTPTTGGKTQVHYRPMTWDYTFSPTSDVKINYIFKQDLDDGTIKDTDLKVSMVIGEDQDYRLVLQGLFQYNFTNDNVKRSLVAERYELATFSLVKYEHCRTFTLSYNRRMEELRFEYKVDAFPSDPVGFVKNKEIWRVEGVLDDKSSERF